MPVCGRCGEDNLARARFCLACGSALVATVPRGDERKVVSVLFCDLVGFTSRAERLDVEDVRGVLRPYYARLRAELERYGGTVEKFIGDAVMALFGAPVTHEDDPERAVRAALAIPEAIAELNQADPALDLHVRVGVTTGEALVALDARPVEGEGMAAGDVVNTAARLQAAAPVDGVLVDEATYWATARHITYQPAEPVAAKGKTEPVPAWQALAARARTGVDAGGAPRTPLVGRARELGLLTGALATVRQERAARLLTLVGMAGIGKSRLLLELLRQVEADPELIVWRQGRCLPYGEGVALGALGELVKAQAGILDTDTAGAAEVKLSQTVDAVLADPTERSWVAAQLRPLAGLDTPDALGSDRRSGAFAAWRRFLEAVAEQHPTVLVVEDLHWADEPLLDFLEHLADWAAGVPLLVVATTRPELAERRPGWGGAGPLRATVTLAPLSQGETARLVTALLNQAVLPAGLGAALLARAGGNPLYAEEYVRMLADRGLLGEADGNGRLDRAAQLPLPKTVQGLIAARLDALGPPDKALLQDAAVLGEIGWQGALAALAQAEPSALEARLGTLERRQLLRRQRHSRVAGERQWAFSHVLVRDVAYQQLPRTARADKHRRAAEWLQALSPDRAEDRAELLAHHYQTALRYAEATGQDTAGLTGPARLALREAGDRASQLNAFAAAARWYAAALELWPAGDPERPRLLLRLGAARLHGEQAGLEELTAARDGLVALGEPGPAAEADVLLGILAIWQGDNARGRSHAERAVALLEGSAPSQAKAYVQANLAGMLVTCAEPEQAAAAARQALAMAEDLGIDDVRMLALDFLGSALGQLGDPAAVPTLEQAVALAVASNSPHSAMAYANLGSSLVGLGDLERGFAAQASGRRAAEHFGLAGELGWLRGEEILEHYWRGRWDDAVAGTDRVVAEAEAGTPSHMMDVCRMARAMIRLARDDRAGALEDVRVGLELARASGSAQAVLPGLAFAARTWLEIGDATAAEATAGELLELVGRDGALLTDRDWSGALAVVLQALGRGAELQRLAAATRSPGRWLLAAVAGGDFAAAADRYAEIGSLPDQAFARLRAAEQLVTAGRPAGGQLRQAIGFFRVAGATAYLRAAEALAAESSHEPAPGRPS
jgi:class 3 adenylate cyclase